MEYKPPKTKEPVKAKLSKQAEQKIEEALQEAMSKKKAEYDN
jgi:hypothetical protein